MSNDLTFIIAIVGLCVSLLSIVSFVINRTNKSEQNGELHGEMRQNIKYIKDTQTEIMVGQKEILNKLDTTNERVTRLEEQVKMHEAQIKELRKK